jgi:DNA-binding MarR family transcriptional regulator
LILFGIIFLYQGYKLPLEEALELIHERGRGVTESEIVHAMRVDQPTAGRILGALIAKGFLRRATDQPSHTEEVFEPVR